MGRTEVGDGKRREGKREKGRDGIEGGRDG